MRTCIITIVKDEQPYLRQWIKYHTGLGIDTLFIFEDIDSSSHANICKEFPNVKLDSVLSVFYNDADRESARRWKSEGRGLQHMYQGLAYGRIRKTGDYDWIFIIDADEYITIEGNRTLHEVLDLYKDYEAVVMQWRNYSADGHYRKPGGEYDLTKTYQKETGYSSLDIRKRIITKVIYGRNAGFRSHHWPVDSCRWCRTDFSQDKDSLIFTNIYIRHYITKSFEEYIDKLYIRKMCYRGHRDIEEFFVYNPEMRDTPESLEIIGEYHDIIVKNP